MPTPHIILLGYGVVDSLQVTVESQRILSRHGSAYSIGLPANLSAFLKSQRVKVTDLGRRLAAGCEYADGYLEIASFVIERTAVERPVILIAPGHPLAFNAVGRYLAMEGRRLGLVVQALPAVSPLDLIIGGIGLDVSTFGLQVFDATRLVGRRLPLSPQVPAIVMNLGGFGRSAAAGDGQVANVEPLVRYLSACYPANHPAVVVGLRESGMTAASVPLSQMGDKAKDLNEGSHLFLDAVRAAPTTGSTAG